MGEGESGEIAKHLYISIYLLDINLYQFIKMVTQKLILKRENLKHSPNLNTVLMVEETLNETGELMTVAELKRRLPRKVMHQTILLILEYLQLSGKIVVGTKGVLWVFTERKELNKLITKGTEI